MCSMSVVRTGVVKGPKAAWVEVAAVTAKAGSHPIAIKVVYIGVLYCHQSKLIRNRVVYIIITHL